VKFPVDALPLVVIVSVAEAAVFGAGVMGLGVFSVMPVGFVDNHEADKMTGELKPACEFTLIASVPLCP